MAKQKAEDRFDLWMTLTSEVEEVMTEDGQMKRITYPKKERNKQEEEERKRNKVENDAERRVHRMCEDGKNSKSSKREKRAICKVKQGKK